MQNMWRKILQKTVAVSTIVLCFPASVEAKTYQNDEYGVRIEAPPGRHVCTMKMMDHAHGFAFNLDAKMPCTKDYTGNRPGTLSIWADYNAVFFSNASEAAPERCTTFPQGQALRNEYKGSVRSWRSCIVHDQHDQVMVTLTLLTGTRGASWGEEAGKPCMIYQIYLTTFRNRLVQELNDLRTFLRGTQLDDAESCGP